MKHRHYPVYGVQFHPESIGTEAGKQLLSNFLGVAHAVA
jgi:anthranilate/para-aminobenzoate synthase component II